MKTLAKLYRGSYRAIEEALETWKTDPEEARSARDLEATIRLCLSLQSDTKVFVDFAWEQARAERIEDMQAAGHYVVSLLESGVVAWECAAETAAWCAAAGCPVEGIGAIPASLAELRGLLEDFSRRWPFVRMEDVMRGSQQIANGAYVTGEDLLREMHSQGG
jgi:hypothetical protein